jgi:RNA polymerase sigma factor (sigma-70 family)
MSNEEFAVAIKSGHTELLPQLYEQTYKLLRLISIKLYWLNVNRLTSAGIEPDDIYQESYFALTNAIRAYDPNNGFAFNTYLKFHLKNRIRSLIGKPNDAALHSTSLDEPITGDNDGEQLLLCDTITDPDSEAEIIGVVENEYRRQLHVTLDKCLDRLNPAEKEAITGYYYNNESFQTMAEKNGTATQNEINLFKKGMRKLRQGKPLQTLRTYL